MAAYFATGLATQGAAISLSAATATKVPTSAQAGRTGLKIWNNTGAVLYWGGSGVTDAKGIPIPDQNESAWIPAADAVYVYSVAGGEIRYVEGY